MYTAELVAPKLRMAYSPNKKRLVVVLAHVIKYNRGYYLYGDIF